MADSKFQNGIRMPSIDNLFTTEDERQTEKQEKVQILPLSELHPFDGHPFEVRDDEEMDKMVDSVKEYGVMTPTIVRPREEGGYEIVSGHRRSHAAERAGLQEVPAIVREMDYDTAIILMVDSNVQREHVLPMEKAKAFQMKLEAIKRQGYRTDLTSPQVAAKYRSDDEVAKGSGISGDTVRRYIRLNNLIPELQTMVNENELKMNPAVELGSDGSMSIGDKFTYAYIKNIKRWMECPVCHEKMTFKKKEKAWVCDSCSYTITEKDFLDDFVLWFCDECGAYLNAQEGFDRHRNKHICRKCGYENDTTFENIKGMCIDCGKVLENPDANLCDDCKQVRKQKAKEWLIKAGKAVGIAAAVVGVAYLASQATDDDASSDYLPMPNSDDGADHKQNFGFINDTWMDSASENELRSVEDEMRSALDGMDYDSDEYLQLDLQRIDVVNAIASRFPLNLPHREHGWYLPNDD